MATIKSYTDIEQSKKLAEILPLESADQTWVRFAIAGANLDVPEELQYRHNGDMPFQYYSGIGTPCWSLAALLDAIPKRISDYNIFRMDINDIDTSMWYDEIGYGVNNDLPDIAMESAVDACYEMIIKLSELKIL